MEYLTNLRIQKAKELILSRENLSLKEIAEIVGYSERNEWTSFPLNVPKNLSLNRT